MLEFLALLAKFGPEVLIAFLVLAIIGGLGYIIFLLVKQDRDRGSEYATLTSNHLHELPDIADTLRRMEQQQASMAAAILTQLADVRGRLEYLAGRINGKS